MLSALRAPNRLAAAVCHVAAVDPSADRATETSDAIDRGNLCCGGDTLATPAFDRLARVAARAVGAPAAFVTIVEGQRQTILGVAGTPSAPATPLWAHVPRSGPREVPLTHSLCAYVVARGKALVLDDARAHPTFGAHPAVRDLGVVAYVGVPLVDADGRPLGTVCATDERPRAWTAADVEALREVGACVATEFALRREVADRRATEQTLRASQERYERIAANIPGIVYQFAFAPDGAMSFPFVSDGVREWFALDPAEIRRDPALLLDRVHADDRAAFDRSMAESITAGAAWQWEGRVVLATGTVAWVQGSSRSGRAADGTMTWDGLLLDVTERRRAVGALRESEERLTLALAAVQDGLWDWDVPSGAAYYSPRWMEMLGYEPNELPARVETFERLTHPDDVDRARAATAAHFADPDAEYAVELRLRTKAAGWRWVLTRGHVVARDASGAPVRMVGTHVDVGERKALEAELRRQAEHDTLTGLANRTRFRDRVERALAKAALHAPAGGVAVLFLDLDDFKAVNDSIGHEAGDRLLTVAAERLLNATRGCDTVARLGGDEFAVLLQHVTGEADTRCVADRVIAALGAPATLDGREVRVAASVGIARARPGDSADDLLRNADLAMYRAKAAGRGRHETFVPEMHATFVERLALAADLRRAVDDLARGADGARGEGFRLVYQPVVDLATGSVVALEALARWHHPARGAVSPAEFIPLAEETGAIVPLGRWALHEACRAAARWPAPPHTAEGVLACVNVSGRQLQDDAFARDVAAALAASGLAPGRLVLEITESVLMQDTEATLVRLRALKALGVRLAVDDFGVGYSSLGYLQQFPVDVLKIDKRFVDGVAHGASGAALARTIIALGEAVGLRTVAEGVERQEQRDALLALGCRLAQGYLFARPLEAHALEMCNGWSRPLIPAAGHVEAVK